MLPSPVLAREEGEETDDSSKIRFETDVWDRRTLKISSSSLAIENWRAELALISSESHHSIVLYAVYHGV